MQTVIEVENLSKAYQLGEFSTGSLSQDFSRWWAMFRGKEDPFLKIGEDNDRTKVSDSNIVWSLKDIDFTIQQGDAFGIIGRNGAGKSTLLKLLSQITNPTTGNIKVKGRIASLLEVGTGFHPELTGRENIFLNGAILGMTKKEIKGKFDEIVAFSGVEKYIDTPVKRYSSGMYVRLAFAVAAHLEPEILIVDEVLAVGDAEFQKKCMGKMKDVSGEGRTVLFVSHNMTAMNTLCNKVLYLDNGRIKDIGEASKVISNYMGADITVRTKRNWNGNDRPGDEIAKLISVRLINYNEQEVDVVEFEKGFAVEMIYEVLQNGSFPIPNIHVMNQSGDHIFVTSQSSEAHFAEIGIHKSTVWLPGNLLNTGEYIIGIAASTLSPLITHFFVREALVFHIIEDLNLRQNDFKGTFPGLIRPKLTWNSVKLI
jgi:lipopolysaccharide transport system ATP-binding protein